MVALGRGAGDNRPALFLGKHFTEALSCMWQMPLRTLATAGIDGKHSMSGSAKAMYSPRLRWYSHILRGELGELDLLGRDV